MNKGADDIRSGTCIFGDKFKLDCLSFGWGTEQHAYRFCKSFVFKWKSQTIFFTTARARLFN